MSTETFFEESKEQSRIKAQIVAEYFSVWAKIILSKMDDSQDNRIAYIDLFAGPGRYNDGTKSTPLLVLENAIQNPMMRERLVTIFNDGTKENAESLKKVIYSLAGIETLKHKPKVGAEEVDEKIVQKLDSSNLIPTFFFVDPWGYKGLSLGLIKAVIKNWGSDCIFFFNYNRINMGINNELVAPHMNELFGKERADRLREQLASLSPADREAAIGEALMEALQELGGKYVLPFCFKGENGKRTSHHLVFVTKHPLGYGIMKDIMARHSSEHEQGVPSLGYVPASALHPKLFELNRPLDDLEGMLLEEFDGQTRTTIQIFERHNVGRRYVLKNYKAVLLSMDERGLIKTDPPKERRKKNTFADTVKVTFPDKARNRREP
jgi:three-Cys-motif partner protein